MRNKGKSSFLATNHNKQPPHNATTDVIEMMDNKEKSPAYKGLLIIHMVDIFLSSPLIPQQVFQHLHESIMKPYQLL